MQHNVTQYTGGPKKYELSATKLFHWHALSAANLQQARLLRHGGPQRSFGSAL